VPAAIGRTLARSGRSWTGFDAERVFVGDALTLQAYLPGAREVRFRIEGPGGWRAEVVATTDADGTARCPWRVPLGAVPGRPGVHRLRILARRERGGLWVPGALPLEVVINPFAFGL